MQSVDKAAGCCKALGAARVKQQLHRRRTSASGRRNARSHTTRHVWQTTCSLGGPHGSLAACDHTYEPIDTDTKLEPQLSVAVRVFYDVNVTGCVVVLLVVRAGGCGATSSVQLAAWCGRGRRVSVQMWGMRTVPVWPRRRPGLWTCRRRIAARSCAEASNSLSYSCASTCIPAQSRCRCGWIGQGVRTENRLALAPARLLRAAFGPLQ